MKFHRQRAAAAVHRFDAALLRLALQQRERNQRFDGGGRRSVAIRDFRAAGRRLLRVACVGDALVCAQALLLVADVLGRDANVEPQVERGVDLDRPLLALQFADRLFEQAEIHIEAHRRNVSVLFAAQQVARAAQFQIERRDLEARAQIRKLSQCRQPLARDFAQLRVLGYQQIRVRSPVRPAHAAAQLVQLGKAVALGIFDDDRVRQRNVQAVLDDRGAHEHVVFVAHEAQQHALQLVIAHLAVPDADAAVR